MVWKGLTKNAFCMEFGAEVRRVPKSGVPHVGVLLIRIRDPIVVFVVNYELPRKPCHGTPSRSAPNLSRPIEVTEGH